MKNKMRYIIIVIFILVEVNIYGQNTHESFKDMISFVADTINGNKHLISSLIVSNKQDTMMLQLKNTSNDTIRILSRVKVESTSRLNYMLICISDSCIRKQTQTFEFEDEYKYIYTHLFWNNYNIQTGEFNCSYINLSDNKMITIAPHATYYTPISFIPKQSKYVFIKIQLRFVMLNQWYTIQQETNSILW